MAADLIAGRYEIEELVGMGGMSSVYRARDTVLERRVALKILHDQYLQDAEHVERFRREARAVAQLTHPNIVTVIDRGEDDGRHFIVFEYVHGQNLKDAVGGGAMPVRDALALVIEIGRGLAFAHTQGLIHRDVKPQNVLLNGDGRPKITDFGIARSLDVERGVTQTGTVLGTSNYIAPEQATGTGVGPATDVYSLGVVLYELLTGEVPFPGESFVAVAMKHINEPPPSVLEIRPDVGPRVAAAVERALAKDPADRFASMEAFVAELRACLAEVDVPAPDADAGVTTILRPTHPRRRGTVVPPRPRARRPRVWPRALLVLALAALGAAAFSLLRERSGDADRAATPVRLAGVASYDPEGDDGEEHSEAVARAADGDPSTYWPTEEYYAAFEKSGVGVVLDAGRAVELTQLTVSTSTPGFRARIQAGASRDGPFRPVSAERVVGATTTFRVDGAGARYYVVWITALERVARINEVKAKGRA